MPRTTSLGNAGEGMHQILIEQEAADSLRYHFDFLGEQFVAGVRVDDSGDGMAIETVVVDGDHSLDEIPFDGDELDDDAVTVYWRHRYTIEGDEPTPSDFFSATMESLSEFLRAESVQHHIEESEWFEVQ